MPLTPTEEANVRKWLSQYKDVFERDHKRKCDAIDAIVKDFIESPTTKEAVKVERRLKSILGDELVKEVTMEIRARRVQASSSASSSTHSNSGPSAFSSSASSVTEDGEVVCIGERTVEDRNREGFANAIVLDEDENEEEDDDQLDAITDLPTQDDEDAFTALLTNMNANLASTKSAAKKSDSNEEELLTVRVLKPKGM